MDCRAPINELMLYFLSGGSIYTLMRICVLYSGGKDSNLALLESSKFFQVACLVSIQPRSSESALFHYPAVDLVALQAEALQLPLIKIDSGDDEISQLDALREALRRAVSEFGVEGVVTGAVKSVYQASRFQRVCDELGLWCFNPLWMMDEEELVRRALSSGFEILITRLAIHPLEERFIGGVIDEDFINYLRRAGASISGEGGEYETFVTWMPMFRRRIRIANSLRRIGTYEGELVIKRAELI